MRRFRDAMSVGPDHPDHSMLISGPRGSGKTVLLAAMRDTAERNDMETVRITAKPEPTFADALVESMAPHPTARHRLSSAQISVLGTGAGMTVQTPRTSTPSIHTRMLKAMEALADRTGRNARGALITIDEFHNSNIAAARDFAHALQDVTKIDGKPVMLAAAGLPTMEETVLSDPGMTFFQRIARIHLEPLTPAEAAEGMQTQVFDPVFKDLSDTDRFVAITMSRLDGEEVEPHDLAHATGKPANYLSVYTNRLSRAGVIHRSARGRLRFVHTTMRDWLRRQHISHLTPPESTPAPKTGTTVKERIIAAHHATPEATHTAIAKRLGTSPNYVGRIRRRITRTH